MGKTAVITAAIVGVIAVGGVALVLTKNDNTDKSSSTTQQSGTTKTADVKLNDPNGDYDLFSDPSVTKYPEKNALFGNGQTLSFEYDGSKTNNDEYATLSYQLYYIQDDGKVQPIGGGNVEGKGKGTFTVSDKVFNSNAKDRTGFLELTGTTTSGTTGTNTKLGMYQIKFDVAD